MTHQERYQFIYEQTDGFRERRMLKHHIIQQFKEIEAETRNQVIREERSNDSAL